MQSTNGPDHPPSSARVQLKGVTLAAKPPLTVDALMNQAAIFAELESTHQEETIYGVTDGKALGTYLEHKFQAYLHVRYTYAAGSSAMGIDFPELGVDMKVTRITQPQSSCPFRSATQKVRGLGYSLLVFVYDKRDDPDARTGNLKIEHTIFVAAQRTGDFQTTTGLRAIIENEGNEDDLVAFMMDRNLPMDEIQAFDLARELLEEPPEVGYLTISNALQWRLQYRRVIDRANDVDGLVRVS